MNTGKIVVSVLASFAAGAAIGILFAPDKGALTRKKISNKKNEFSNELEKKFNSLVTGMNDKYDKISSEVQTLAKTGTEKTEQFLKDVAGNGVKA